MLPLGELHRIPRVGSLERKGFQVSPSSGGRKDGPLIGRSQLVELCDLATGPPCSGLLRWLWPFLGGRLALTGGRAHISSERSVCHLAEMLHICLVFPGKGFGDTVHPGTLAG